jgi:carboxypeptidase Taq
MTITNPTVKKLLEKYKDISLLNKISALLNWDLNVNMPPKAAHARAEQSAYIAQLITEKWHEKTFRKLTETVQKEKNLSAEELAIVRNITHATKFFYSVPKEIIIKKEKITSLAFPVWAQAREENDFKKFLPHLEQIVEISQQIAKHLGYQTNPYDALLDLFEPELSAKDCQKLFDGMKADLIPLISKIIKSKKYIADVPFVNNKIMYAKEDQRKIIDYVVAKMGFDFAAGRIDTSPHPFTIGLATQDVRLTTHYSDYDFHESLIAAIHEAGHGLYEQGINPTYTDTPLEGGTSLGIHESLSRFWENMIGKNPSFIQTLTPLFRENYPQQLKNVNEQTLIQVFNLVKPSLIRVYADEITYSLHIILRFEMENELINNKLKVKDAPDVWREKSKKLFGIVPVSDKDGILQDVHWTYGAIGYFPSYAIGNIYGAQFLNSMKKDFDFDDTVEKGDLKPVKDWLDKNIHTYGSLYYPKELLQKVTGEAMNHKYFIDYLTKKYSKIYSL